MNSLLSEHQRAQYEFALDLLTDMIGLLSSRIHREQTSSQPDLTQIKNWEDERTFFSKKRYELDSSNLSEINEIIEKYSAILKNNYSGKV